MKNQLAEGKQTLSLVASTRRTQCTGHGMGSVAQLAVQWEVCPQGPMHVLPAMDEHFMTRSFVIGHYVLPCRCAWFG